LTELALRAERVVTPSGVRAADLVVRDRTIAALEQPAAGRAVTDLGDCWLLPGFVDVHVHGGGGAQCNTPDVEEVQRVARFHAQHGTTALLGTTVAAPIAELVAATTAIRRAAAAPEPGAAEVLGAHLEGPFLSPLQPGAMDPAQFATPDPATLEELLAAGGVRLMTIAPELPGALESIGSAVAAGVVVSMGHSHATHAEAAAAVQAGARSLTHAFNAARPLHHREPGVVGAALDSDDVFCELICDGIHVDPVVVRLVLRAKGPARTLLVTDAIEAAGLPDGSHRLGARTVSVAGGRATLPGTQTIAGSTLTMDRAVRNAVELGSVSVEAAARMASTAPAELLGIADRKGTLAPGADADVVVLAPDLSLTGVMVRGEWARSAW
jgi:N-acetylglucosamine-6-phosphate deacetylase